VLSFKTPILLWDWQNSLWLRQLELPSNPEFWRSLITFTKNLHSDLAADHFGKERRCRIANLPDLSTIVSCDLPGSWETLKTK